MARRKARIPQGKKLQPAVKTMTFQLPSAPEATNFYIDLSQCASLLNRRFYRQGLNWAVAGFTWYTVADGSLRINKIPDTWVASNAWQKGFSAWQEMQDKALEDTESVKPKFNDFKVYMDSGHHTNGSANNLIPRVGSDVGVGNSDYTLGTWDYSKAIIPITEPDAGAGSVAERDFIWTGSSYPGTSAATGNNAVSLIEGYAASRGLPDITDPNVPDDSDDTLGGTPENWISAIDNEGIPQEHEVIEDIITDNTNAPYPFENGTNSAGVTFGDTQYPGGANQAPGLQEAALAFVTTTTIGGRTQIPGENFQGGLINLELQHIGSSIIQVHLVAGPHRGYMCQKMQDV